MIILCMFDPKCVICEKIVDKHGSNTLSRDMHYSCVDERARREQKGLCIMCGEKLKPKDINKDILKHNKCVDPQGY